MQGNLPAEPSSLPEVVAHREKEAVPSHGKEVAGAHGKEVRRSDAQAIDGPQAVDDDAPEVANAGGEEEARKADKVSPHSSRRKRRILIAAVVVLVVCLAIGLGVGLGVGLNAGNNSSSSSQTSTGSQYLSKRGAYNGTSISWTGVYGSTNLTSHQPAENEDWKGNDRFLFFQHHTGSIRWMYQNGPDDWRGGSEYEIITTEAKMLTPLSVMSPGDNGVQEYSLYYVNKDNYVRQLTIDSNTFTWTDGPFNKLNIKALDSDTIGMKACLNLGPIAGVSADETKGHGTRFFVATGEDTFEQYSWYPGMTNWVYEQTWHDLNGHASPACFGWAKGHTFYVWFVTPGNNINMYWYDTANVTSTATHPINSWALSSMTFPAVDPSMGLDFHYLLYGRLATGTLEGWNMTLEAENSTLSTTPLDTVDGPQPLENSQLAVSSAPPFGGDHREAIILFYQVEGDDITMFTGLRTTGEWNSTRLPIPDG